VTHLVAKYAAKRFGQGTKLAMAWIQNIRTQIYGKRQYRPMKSQKRRGGTKQQRKPRTEVGVVHLGPNPQGAGEEFTENLIKADHVLAEFEEAHGDLMYYAGENADRADYPSHPPWLVQAFATKAEGYAG
jgi:hypothetical protein